MTPPSDLTQERLARRTALLGLFDRRERWGLTAKGAILSVFAFGVFLSLAIFATYPFLATTHRLDTDYLVVEGWISKAAIRSAADEIRNGGYKLVFTTGGPSSGTGAYSNDYNTSASVGYGRLVEVGVPEAKLQKVPSRVRDRDRTYSAALALKSWLQTNHLNVASLNVFTESVHARRSRLLFQKALGSQITVGVIAAPPADYPADRWWRYSEGVKELISESAGYIYARLFFWP